MKCCTNATLVPHCAGLMGGVARSVVGAAVGMEVAAEGVQSRACKRAEIGFDAAQGVVHNGDAAGGCVVLFRLHQSRPLVLTVDENVRPCHSSDLRATGGGVV